MNFVKSKLDAVLQSGDSPQPRPAVGKGNESSVPGVYIIGDLAGAPVIKLAMAQGVEVVDYISTLPEMQTKAEGDVLDFVIVGAGAAGLNAALAAKDKGYRFVILEKGVIANTIENFPEGKWVYAEPDQKPPKGKLWLDGARKEDLVDRWRAIVEDNQLDVRTEEPLTGLEKQKDGTFVAKTAKNEFRCKKVILATGQRGNPRKLGVPGEHFEHVYHRLYSPTSYQNENILVVGGGNSAIEAALTLSKRNQVTLSYRGSEFGRVFKDNLQQLDTAIADKRIEVVFHSQVSEFGRGEATLDIDRGGHTEQRKIEMDHAFVLVGAELPVKFLRMLGVKLENEWDGSPLRSLLLTIATFLGLWFLGPSLGGAAPLGIDMGTAGTVGGGAIATLGMS